MEVFGISVQDLFYIIGSVFMAVLLLVLVGSVIAVLAIKRKVTRKIADIKAAPLRGKVFATTFLKTLFR